MLFEYAILTVRMSPFSLSDQRRRYQRNVGRIWCAMILLIVAIGVVVPHGPLYAQSMSLLLNYLLMFLSFLLEKIMQFFGYLIVMLIDMVISIAQYNTFTAAAPVQIGWPLIRDIVNMFFIVILLVVAFSTIVRWKKFYYKDILPKLLIMAVLVNFSMTFVGIMIDFSQVLMLTFVNGFKAAAAGNFVTAFKLDKVMKINSPDTLSADSSTTKDSYLTSIVVAQFFGVFILGITATLMVIMVVYLIVRIVGLWIALILSPAAFFLTAVPPAIKGKVAGMSDEFWDKLGALLSGGPVIAFFLWLTLATVQNVGSFQAANYAGKAEMDQIHQHFITAMGTVDDFATYLVAVIMLFMGVSTAISVSGGIHSSLKKPMEKIRDVGMGTTKFLAYGGLAAGTAWTARRAGSAAATGIDRRVELTKRVGGVMQKVGIKTGMGGLADAGVYVGGIRKRAVEKEREAFEGRTKNLTEGEKIGLAKGRIRARFSGNADERKAMTEIVAKESLSKGGTKHLMEEFEKEGQAQGMEGEQLEAYKKKKTAEEQRARMKDYEIAAKGDKDKEKDVKEKKEAMPMLAEDAFTTVQDRAGDPGSINKIALDQYDHSDVTMGVIAGSGVFKGNEIDKDHWLEKKMKGSGKQARALREQVEAIKQYKEAHPEDGRTIEEFLQDRQALEASGLLGGTFVKDETNHDTKLRYVSAAGAPAPSGRQVAEARGHVIRDENAIHQQAEIIRDRRNRLVGARSMPAGQERTATETGLRNDLRTAQRSMLAAGASLNEIYDMDAAGNFRSDEERRAYEEDIAQIQTNGEQDVNNYNNIDVGILTANPNSTNEARRAFAQKLDVQRLHTAYERALQNNNARALRSMSDMVRAVDIEGDRVENMIKTHNRNTRAFNERRRPDQAARNEVDLSRVQAAAAAGVQDQLTTALAGTNLNISMDDAKILHKRSEIYHDENLRNFETRATPAAAAAVRRGRTSAPRGERRAPRERAQGGGAGQGQPLQPPIEQPNANATEGGAEEGGGTEEET